MVKVRLSSFWKHYGLHRHSIYVTFSTRMAVVSKRMVAVFDSFLFAIEVEEASMKLSRMLDSIYIH